METINVRKTKMRWWIPAIIAVLAVANVVRVRASADLDVMFKNLQTFLTGVVSLGLLLLWWLFLTKLRWRARLAGLALIALVAFSLKRLVRIDGSTDGTGKPRIVWNWAPKKSGEVGGLKSVGPVKESPRLEATADYPGYLGRDRSGVVVGIQLERDWAAHPPQELWRRPIGLGWSGFSISGSPPLTQE